LPAGKALLVRPEQLRLSPTDSGGTVRAVRFFGSYYETEVTLAGATLRARTPTAAHAVGDTVAVSLIGSPTFINE